MRTLQVRLALAIMAVAAATPLWAQIDPASMALMPPKADFVAGVEWRRLANSPLAAMAKQQMTSQSSAIPGMSLPLGAFEDMVKDIESLVIAGTSIPNAAPNSKNNTKVLAIVKGTFNRALIRSNVLKSGKMETYREIELYAPADTKPSTMRIAVLDQYTLVFGDLSEVRSAIDRRFGFAPGRPNTELLSRIATASPGKDIWVVLKSLPSPPAGAAQNPGSQLMSEVSSLDLGVTLSNGMTLEANLHAKSAASAQKLAQAVQGVMALAAMGDKQNTDTAEMLSRLQVVPTESSVRIAMSMSEAELERSIQQAQGRIRLGGESTAQEPVESAPVVTEQEPPEDPSKPKTIRIEGLDGGPVEIEIKKPEKK